MSHIFISYSRKDLDIAEKIVNALVKDDLEPWIDWKSIPKGETFEEEIERGIEEADIFLFLVSPNSIQSDWCNKEIAHAIKNGKRILSIVLHDTNPKSIHPEISKRNWIYCRSGQDDFNNAIEETRKTVHTDYEWLKYHTELQVKALRWEQKEDNSRLLRGKELRDAEEQLSGGGSLKDPQPTELQRNYVLVSQRNEIGQRRQVTIGLTITSVIIFGIAIAAIWQWQRAEEQALIALSRQLAAQALALESKQVDLSGLLAVEALNLSDNGNTRDALLTWLHSHLQLVRYLHGHTGSVNGIAFSPDGKTIVSAGDNNQIFLWDAASGQQLGKLISDYESSGVSSMSLSPDGKILATAGGWVNPYIILWDMTTLQQIGLPISGHTDYITQVTFSPDGTILASTGHDNVVILWNVQTHEIIGQPLTGINMAFSPDGKMLAIIADDRSMTLWDVKTQQVIRKAPNLCCGVTFSPDGKTLVSSSVDEKNNTLIRFWDVETLSVVGSLSGSAGIGSASNFVLSPDGKLLAAENCTGAFMGGTCNQGSASIIIWNLETNKPIGVSLLGHNNWISDLVFSPDSKVLASGSRDGTIILWRMDELQSASPLLRDETSMHYSLVAALSPDNETLALGGCNKEISPYNCKKGQILFWDLLSQQFTEISLMGHESEVTGLAYSADGQILASGAGDGTIILWDMKNHKPFELPPFTYDGKFAHLALSPNRKYLVYTSGASVIMWDLEKRPPIEYALTLTSQDFSSVDNEPGEARELAFSPDGMTLATGYYNGQIYLWDLTTHIPRKLHRGFSTVIGTSEGIAFSADGRLLASISGPEILIWDAIRGEQIGRPLTTLQGIAEVAFSPDGKMLVTASDDILFWDLATHMQIGQPIYSGNNFVNLHRLPFDEGGNLLFVNQDGSTSMWGTSVEVWKSQTCSKVSRNLTRSEWNQYIGDILPYQAVCPNFPLEPEIIITPTP